MKLPIEEIIEWDVNNWSKALIFWTKQFPPNLNSDSKILLLGERNGGLTLWLTLLGYNVISSDYDGITDQGKSLHEKYNQTEKIEYKKINIYSIPYSKNYFDLIICKSVLGGLKKEIHDKNSRTLQNQKIAVNEIYRTLKPGGKFFGAENMKGSIFHQFIRKILKKDKGWRYLEMQDLDYFFSDFSYQSYCQFGFLGTFFESKFLNAFLGTIDRLLSRILPNKTLYISFFVTTK
jgi:SAM-dependent methyltransferase